LDMYTISPLYDRCKNIANSLPNKVDATNVLDKYKEVISVPNIEENKAKIKDILRRANWMRYMTAHHILMNNRVMQFITNAPIPFVRAFLSVAYRYGLYLPKKQMLKILFQSLRDRPNVFEYDISNELPKVIQVIVDNFCFDPGGKNKIYNVPETISFGNEKLKVIQSEPREIFGISKIIIPEMLLDKTHTHWYAINDLAFNTKNMYIFAQGTDRKIVNKHILNYRQTTKAELVSLFKNVNKYKIPITYKDNVISISFDWNYTNKKFDTKGIKDVPADIIITNEDMPSKWDYNKVITYMNNQEHIWYVYKGITVVNNKIGIWQIQKDLYLADNALIIPKTCTCLYNGTHIEILVPDLKINRLKTKEKLPFSRNF